MSFQDSLIRGKQKVPPRICVYGPHGIGKSTMGNSFPKPIFISTEDGLDAMDVHAAFPQARKLAEVQQSIATLVKEEHDFRTVVLDTVDWLVEPLIDAKVREENDPKELSYGKGAVLVAEEFRNILQGFDVLRRKRGMNVLLIAHAEIRRFENPMTEPYDVWKPKLPPRCNALLQEWTDVLAFANFKVIIKKTDVGFNSTVRRGITTGDRLLHMVETPAFTAKSRYSGVPETVDMKLREDGSTDLSEFAKFIPVEGMGDA